MVLRDHFAYLFERPLDRRPACASWGGRWPQNFWASGWLWSSPQLLRLLRNLHLLHHHPRILQEEFVLLAPPVDHLAVFFIHNEGLRALTASDIATLFSVAELTYKIDLQELLAQIWLLRHWLPAINWSWRAPPKSSGCAWKLSALLASHWSSMEHSFWVVRTACRYTMSSAVSLDPELVDHRWPDLVAHSDCWHAAVGLSHHSAANFADFVSPFTTKTARTSDAFLPALAERCFLNGSTRSCWLSPRPTSSSAKSGN